jgi:hypothetical protein
MDPAEQLRSGELDISIPIRRSAKGGDDGREISATPVRFAIRMSNARTRQQ